MKFRHLIFCLATLLGLMVEQSSAACGNNVRQITVENSPINLEVNDTLQLTAHASFGGGCDILNWPVKPGTNGINGHFNNNYAQPSATVDWGDGSSGALQIAWDGTLTGAHQYTKTVLQKGTFLKIVVTGYYWNEQGQFQERVSNECDGAGVSSQKWEKGMCTPHPVNIAVFDPMRPASAQVVKPVPR